MKTGISLLLVMIFISCGKSELPKSVKKLSEKNIIITLKDKNYKTVYLGTDAYGEWQNLDMFNSSGYWKIQFQCNKKSIQYKFWINELYWINDPLNKNTIEVPKPYNGVNSYVEF